MRFSPLAAAALTLAAGLAACGKAPADIFTGEAEATDEVDAGLKKDPEGFLAEKGPDPFDDFNEAALDLGLDECVGDE